MKWKLLDFWLQDVLSLKSKNLAFTTLAAVSLLYLIKTTDDSICTGGSGREIGPYPELNHGPAKNKEG